MLKTVTLAILTLGGAVLVRADRDASPGLTRWASWRTPSQTSMKPSSSDIARELDAAAAWSRHSSRFLHAMCKGSRTDEDASAENSARNEYIKVYSNGSGSSRTLLVRTHNATLPTDTAPVTGLVVCPGPDPIVRVEEAISVAVTYAAVVDRAIAVAESGIRLNEADAFSRNGENNRSGCQV